MFKLDILAGLLRATIPGRKEGRRESGNVDMVKKMKRGKRGIFIKAQILKYLYCSMVGSLVD